MPPTTLRNVAVIFLRQFRREEDVVYDVIQIFTHFDVSSDGSPWCEKRMIDVSLLPLKQQR